MEITSDFESKNFLFPLPIYKTVKIGEATSKDGEHFSIFVGLNENIVSQLKILSLDENDTELQKNTSDFKRFGIGLYENWYKKERTPFTLINTKTNTLAGIVWFGPKPLGRKSLKHLANKELKEDETLLENDNWHTISYRCYPNFRGKGLVKKFVAFAMNVYIKNVPHIKLWAGINTENTASEKLAEGLGFKTLEKLSNPEDHFLVMVKY